MLDWGVAGVLTFLGRHEPGYCWIDEGAWYYRKLQVEATGGTERQRGSGDDSSVGPPFGHPIQNLMVFQG